MKSPIASSLDAEVRGGYREVLGGLEGSISIAEVDVDRANALGAEYSEILLAVSVEVSHDHRGRLERRRGGNRRAVGERAIPLAQQNNDGAAVGGNRKIGPSIAIEVANRRPDRAAGLPLSKLAMG